MRLLSSFLVLSISAFGASPIIFGGRGGALVSDSPASLANTYGSGSINRTYVVGPTLGVRLPLGFSVEGDALYNRQSLNFGQFGGLSAATHADSWEFPVMAKFTAGKAMIAPVFGAGVSVRHINDFGSVPSYLFGSTEQNTIGWVASAGFQFRAGPMHVTPEFRYTRWESSNFAQSIVDSFVPGRNAAQVLIGLTF